MNIKEIAKLAGVSTSTVSKIINQKDNDISIETRRRVQKVIDEYHYVPYAKVLKNNPIRTWEIGIFISDLGEHTGRFLKGVEYIAQKAGYRLVFRTLVGDRKTQEKELKQLIASNVEGIIWFSNALPRKELMDYGWEKKCPIILVGNMDSKVIKVTGQVQVNYLLAGKMAVEHLISNGHHNIGYFYTIDDGVNKSIHKGYLELLLEVGYTCEHTYNKEQIKTGGIDLILDNDITGVVCSDTESAGYLIQKLHSRGIDVPKDLSIVIAQDSVGTQYMCPALTAISIDYELIGTFSVELLLSHLEDKHNQLSLTQDIVFRLIERNSVAVPSKFYKIRRKKILVIGNMNMDAIIHLSEKQKKGEIVIAEGVSLMPGGKGANQAVGAGRLGGNVIALGCLGKDADGKALIRSLTESGVNISGIHMFNNKYTGKAYINVQPNGESSGVVYPGANYELSPNLLEQDAELFKKAHYCLIAMETQWDTVKKAVEMCKKSSVKVIWKPSVIGEIDDEILLKVDYIIPNEKELNYLVPEDLSVMQKADQLYNRGVENVLVTLGSKGVYLKNKEYAQFFPAVELTQVDSTGASDALISALAVALSEEKNILEAIHFATCAAGISITREGVQAALPERNVVDIYKERLEAVDYWK